MFMCLQNKIITIVCEGPSENAYIQEINRLFKEEEIPLTFIGRPSEGGHYKAVISKYKSEKDKNPRSDIRIWVDWDRYMRNDSKDMDHYKKKSSKIPNFLFSYMNFEDFLVLHLTRDKLNQWISSCIRRNHFKSPSKSNEYLDEFKHFIGGYSKGEIPIEISKASLENLKRNQEDLKVPIKCDFAKELFELIDKVC